MKCLSQIGRFGFFVEKRVCRKHSELHKSCNFLWNKHTRDWRQKGFLICVAACVVCVSVYVCMYAVFDSVSEASVIYTVGHWSRMLFVNWMANSCNYNCSSSYIYLALFHLILFTCVFFFSLCPFGANHYKYNQYL